MYLVIMQFLLHTIKVKLSLGLFRHYAIQTYKRRKIQINEFLTFVLDGGEWSTSRPGHFIPHRKPSITSAWAGKKSLPPIVKRILIPLLFSSSTKPTHKLSIFEFYILLLQGFKCSSQPLLSSTPKLFYLLDFTPMQNRPITKVLMNTYILAYDALSSGKQITALGKHVSVSIFTS
jgi:hypothetical protein